MTHDQVSWYIRPIVPGLHHHTAATAEVPPRPQDTWEYIGRRAGVRFARLEATSLLPALRMREMGLLRPGQLVAVNRGEALQVVQAFKCLDIELTPHEAAVFLGSDPDARTAGILLGLSRRPRPFLSLMGLSPLHALMESTLKSSPAVPGDAAIVRSAIQTLTLNARMLTVLCEWLGDGWEAERRHAFRSLGAAVRGLG